MATQALGPRVADGLRRRLADLRAARTINDLILGNATELAGTRGLQVAVSLRDGYRAIFRANHMKNPVLANGHVDWSAVDRVKLMRIERSND
jgi:hypothetical protein